MARPEIVVTEQDRELVESMSGYGVPYEQIASLVCGGIHRDTLSKHFSVELTKGKAKANSAIGQNLFQKAVGGDTSALIFWAKTQMGWKETQVQETKSVSDMSDTELDAKIAEKIAQLNG